MEEGGSGDGVGGWARGTVLDAWPEKEQKTNEEDEEQANGAVNPKAFSK